MSLTEIMRRLSGADDISWGMYAFSRDILRDRIPPSRKEEMIRKAVACGERTAREAIARWGTPDPGKLAAVLGLKVAYEEQGKVGDRILFAFFTPPNQIQIFREPIARALGEEEMKPLLADGILSEQGIKDLILGHEIFHCLEERDEGIYTRQEQIVLWKLFGYCHRSTVRAVSEIAAMAFTRYLNRPSYSPFALDILLYYNYDKQEALRMCGEVIKD